MSVRLYITSPLVNKRPVPSSLWCPHCNGWSVTFRISLNKDISYSYELYSLICARVWELTTRVSRFHTTGTQRQNECACAFPPFSRAGASRETGFKRNHLGENGGKLKIPVRCFHFAEISPSQNR